MNYADHLHALATIANKPSASPRTILIATRRSCRLLAGEYGRLYSEHQALKRKMAKLERAMPFARVEIAAITERCAVLEGIAGKTEAVMISIAEMIAKDGGGLSQALGFEALCDLLEVHPLHREKARQNGESIAHIVGADIEGSNTPRRPRPWLESPPLTAVFDAGVRCVYAELAAQARAGTIH